MPERPNPDPDVVAAAEIKRRQMSNMDERMHLLYEELRPNWLMSHFDGRSPAYEIWVNPEEKGDNVPALIVAPDGLRKSYDTVGESPSLADLKQPSYEEYQQYFDRGVQLIQSYSEFSKFLRGTEVSAADLKDLVHLLYETEKGEDSYEADGIMLVGEGNQIQVTASEQELGFMNIEFRNGLPDYAGEEVKYFRSDTQPHWKVGVYNSFYSEMFRRSFRMEESGRGNPIYAEESLNSADLQRVGRRLIDEYLKARAKGILPRFS